MTSSDLALPYLDHMKNGGNLGPRLLPGDDGMFRSGVAAIQLEIGTDTRDPRTLRRSARIWLDGHDSPITAIPEDETNAVEADAVVIPGGERGWSALMGLVATGLPLRAEWRPRGAAPAHILLSALWTRPAKQQQESRKGPAGGFVAGVAVPLDWQ